MKRQFRVIIGSILAAFVLAGCQTTAIRSGTSVKVTCQSLSYDFVSRPKANENCRRFDITEFGHVIPVERFVTDGEEGIIITDLRFYDNEEYYRSVESNLENAYNFDFESQFKTNINNTENKAVIDFLRKLDLQFFKIIHEKKIVLWRVISSYAGNTYNGFAFAKFFSNAGKKYQLAGFYMELTVTPMREDHFISIIDGIRFNQTNPRTKPVAGTVKERLARLKKLEEDGLLTKNEAAEKRKEILKGL